MRKIRNAARWGLYLIHTGLHFVLIPLLRRRLFGTEWGSLWAHLRFWARTTHKIFGIQVELDNPLGVDLTRQYILVANHRSWFDQTALTDLYPRPIHFLAKSGYFDLPIFGYALAEVAQCVAVRDRKIEKDSKDSMLEYLERGDDVLFFPEGTRGIGRELLPFRSGSFSYSASTGIPVLPIYLLGTGQILSKHEPKLALRPGKITIRIGKPVRFTEAGLHEEMAAFERQYREEHDRLYRG